MDGISLIHLFLGISVNGPQKERLHASVGAVSSDEDSAAKAAESFSIPIIVRSSTADYDRS